MFHHHRGKNGYSEMPMCDDVGGGYNDICKKHTFVTAGTNFMERVLLELLLTKLQIKL